MCGGGTTQTSTVSIPPEVLKNYQEVFGIGKQIASKPFVPYSKDPNAFVAGMTPTQQASLENINAIQGMASGDVAQGQGMIGRGVGQGSDLQRASLGTAAEGQGIGSQLFGKSLGTSEAGLGAAAQIYGQAMPSIARGTAVGERYGSDAARNLYSGIAQAQPYMGEAAGLTRSGLGVGQQYAGLAGDYLGAGTQAVGVGDLDTEKYMSPYVNQVVRAQQALQAEENEAQRSALKGQAIRAGAFGGDRAGVAQANLARQQSLANQATLANILQQGYGQAQGVAGQQQQLGLGAAQANRAAQQFGAQQAASLGQQQFGQSLSAAQQQAALGQALYGQNIGQGQAIAGLGQQQYAQGLGTAQATAGMGKDIYGMSAQQAQLQQAAAQGMFGQAAQVAALQQGAGNNMFNYGLQGGQGIANLGLANQQAQMQAAQAQMQMGQIQQQTDQAGKTALYNQFTQQQGFPYQQAQFLANLAMGTGALSGSTTTTNTSGGGPFSDRRLKDNIEKVGETFDGQPIYRYNYKGEDRTQIGLMAQDVEKDNPKAVGSSQGYKTLDYKKATDEAAERGHFYSGGLVPAAMGGAVGPENAYEGYARGGYAEGGWTQTRGEEDSGGQLTPAQWTNSATGEIKYGSDPTVREAEAAKAAADVSGIDPRINQFYQESMFRDAEPEGAKYWQQQLDRGASIEDVRSQIAGSRERNLVNQAPLTYDASKFADYAAPVRNRYGSASAPAGSYASSFQTQPVDPQASGKGPSTGQQMGGYSGYQQPMGYGGGYQQPMGYGQQQASGKGPQSGMYGGGYQQPSQMSQFNQGYGQGYMGGYQPMQQPQASGKGVGPSSYQSNYGYSNPYGMGSAPPQASGKGPSSSGGGASGFRNGGRIGYAGGGHIDPNDLAALASQRMMELAPHAAGMPGQTMPGAQSYVSNKQLHVPKLVTSNVPPPRQQASGLGAAMAHAEQVEKLGGMFKKAGSFVPEGLKKAATEVKDRVVGSVSGTPDASSGPAAPAPSADVPAGLSKPVSFEAGAGGEFYVPEYMPDLDYASGGLVPKYAMGGTLPYGGGPGGGGYIPEELLQPQQIQGLPRDNEQLKAAGAKATAGGSGGLGDVMKAGNLGYKLAPESLKTSIKSMLPGATPTTPAAGLGAAAETAPIAAANAAAPAAEAAAGLGAAAAPAAEIAGLGAAAAPAAEAAAALPALLGAGEAAALGSTAAAGLGSAATAASAAAPLAAAGAEGLTALLAFLPFLSDRRAKENIEPIGKTYDGQTIYRYNYKGDDATQIGLIAQEVEKRHKDAVGSSNGMKTVDYKRATEKAADRGHFYNGGVIPFRRGYADGMTVDEADLPAIGAQEVSRSRPSDEEYAIRTIAAEMGGRSPEEARGIAAVIENRRNSGRWGEGYKDVVTARNQFEPWNKPEGPNYPMRFAADSPRMQMARAAFEARGDDPTGGALHFYAPAAQAILAQTQGDRAAVPSWARGREATDIGPTRFVRGVDGAPRPPKNIPSTEEAARPPANIPSGAGPAADQAIAVAKQPSAVAPATPAAPKKDDGSFPIRPPATARGKEQDWSDFLTSKQFILPALTAIGTMGTTPTRDFGTALSAGLLGGVKSYQDLDKTLVGQELEGRKVASTEQTTRTATFTKNMELLELLNRRAAALRGRGEPIPPELANQIRDVTKQLTESGAGQSLASSAAALTPQGRQDIQQGATAAGRVGVTPLEEKKPTTEAPSSAVPSDPAAKKPDPQIPTMAEASSVPPSALANSEFLSKLDPDFNPIELNKRAREMAEYDPAASRLMFERATALQQEMNRTGFGTAIGGGVVPIPGHADEKVLRDAAPKLHESFEQQAAQYRQRQIAKDRLVQIGNALSTIKSGKFGPELNEFVAGMRAAGFPIENSASINPELAQEVAKNAWKTVFDELKAIGGQPRVLEMQGLQQSGANLGLEPKANKKILASALAQFNYEDKFFEDATKAYKDQGYKYSDSAFMPEWRSKNRLDALKEEAEKNLAIRGATPVNSNGSINFNELKDGHTYIIEPGMMPGVTAPTKYRVTRDKDGKRQFEGIR